MVLRLHSHFAPSKFYERVKKIHSMAAPLSKTSGTTIMMFFKNSIRVLRPLTNVVSHTQRRFIGKAMQDVKLLKRGEHKIAYKVISGESPGIIFCPGFQSNMMGVKATALETYAKEHKLAYVRFDYQGCGQSTGNLRDATLTDWKKDLLAVIDNVTAGPQIIVGSSIGGLLMLQAAEERQNRIHALVGIATAADFPERLISNYPQDVQEMMKKTGVAEWSMDGHKYVLTKAFLDDAQKNHNILNRPANGGADDGGVRVTHPVRLLHGMEDAAVPYSVSLRVAAALWSNDVNVTLSKLSDHRFSQPEDIQLLFEMLDYLIHGADESRDLAIKSWKAFTIYSHKKKIIKEKFEGKTL